MNGNFEIDKGSYPYTATRIGDATYVLHTPTQQKVLEVPLPHSVAANVALRINTNYHAAKAGGTKFDGSQRAMLDTAYQEVATAYGRRDVGGAVCQQLNDALFALEV